MSGPPPPPPPPYTPGPSGVPPGMKQVMHPATGLELAGFGDRLLATIIDSLIQFVVLLPLSVPVLLAFVVWGRTIEDEPSPDATVGIGLVLVFLLVILLIVAVGIGYLVWSIGGPAGQTLGKHLMRVRVVDEHRAASIGYGRAALRELLGKWLSGALFYLGYLWMLWDPRRKTWHDMIATSQVIKLPASEPVSIGRWWRLVRGRER